MDRFQQGLQRELPRGLDGALGLPVEARWARLDELSDGWSHRDKDGRCVGIFLGYRGGKSIGSVDDRHVVTVAGSRAGKGVSLVIPNLLLYDGSVLAIDPKGELARTTKHARDTKGPCFVLDPFGANRVYPTNSFNPLTEIDPASLTAVDDAAKVAEALIMMPERGEMHWAESARLLLRSLILLTLTLPKATERNLVTVRELLTLQHHRLSNGSDDAERREARLFVMMQRCMAFDGVVAQAGQSFASTETRERTSIFSTARTQTQFLDSLPLRATLKHSDFNLADLKRGTVSVFLSLPANRMEQHARWLRLIISLALLAFERDHAEPDIPVLLLLEELPVLGHMAAIESAAGQIAGFGVKMWSVLQDLTQLQKHYDKSWETFIGNAGVLTFFSNTDATTLRYVSEKLGTSAMLVDVPSGVTLGARRSGAAESNKQLRVDPLLSPHEVERFFARQTGRLLVLAAGKPPVIVERALYYQDSGFEGLRAKPS
jgi:type IV secretion system protein VirD4